MKTEQIYVVQTEGDCEGGRSTSILGYAKGDPKDIEITYKPKAHYKITLQPVTLFHIAPESVAEQRALIEERERLKTRLGELEKKII